MTRAKVVVSSEVSSRTGGNRLVGLCGSLGSAGLYDGWCSDNGVRSEMNLCASVNKDEFCLSFVVVGNPLIDILKK